MRDGSPLEDEDGGGRGADVTAVPSLLGEHPGLGFGSAASHLGSTGGAGNLGSLSDGFPTGTYMQGTLQSPVGSHPCVGRGHPRCRAARAEPGCGGCPRRKGCLLSLSSCLASVADGAENFQKLYPGCVSYGCRTFPDPFLYPFPGASLLLAPGGGCTPPLLPAALRSCGTRDIPSCVLVVNPSWMGGRGAADFGVAGLGAGRHCLRREQAGRQAGSGGGTFPSWKAGSDYVFARMTRSLKITGRSLL